MKFIRFYPISFCYQNEQNSLTVEDLNNEGITELEVKKGVFSSSVKVKLE